MSGGLVLPMVILVGAVVAVPAAVARRQYLVATGFVAAGAGVSLQTPSVYRAVDRLFGGANLTNLLYHLLTLVGIAAFVLLVWTADRRRSRRLARTVVAWTTVVVSLLDVVLFTVGGTTAGWARTDMHLDSRVASPLFLVYAAPLWLELGGLAVATIATQHRQTRGRGWSLGRAGVGLITTGSVLALVWVGNVVVVASIAVATGRVDSSDRAGSVLALAAGSAVFVGLAVTNLPHIGRFMHLLRLDATSRALWRRAASAAPEVVLAGRGRTWIGSRASLYRRWVEIEDALRLDRLQLSTRERKQVESMERLFAPGSVGSVRLVRKGA